MKRFVVSTVAIILCQVAAFAATTSYPFEVLPAEHQKQVDAQTGAELIFVTTNPAKDNNLYFHDRSWLADESMMLFTSGREKGGLMGYIMKTGELVRLTTPTGGMRGATASVNRKEVFYALRGDDCVEITLKIDSSKTPSQVTASERVLCTLEKCGDTTGFNESCDGKKLAIGRGGFANGSAPQILIINVADGKLLQRIYVPIHPGYAGHVQWSHTDPNTLSFAGLDNRLQIIDARTGYISCAYIQAKNEMVTHESWWVNDTMLFCGGTHAKPKEDAHVKQIDPKTGIVRIVGEGAWWDEAKPIDIAKRNWWHSAGSDDGFWVAGDNWHGDIMLFEGKTTRPHLLTAGHRTYGKGDHPHVGWDRKGEKVVFTSHMLGNPNVCIAIVPPAWRIPLPENSANNYPTDRPKPIE